MRGSFVGPGGSFLVSIALFLVCLFSSMKKMDVARMKKSIMENRELNGKLVWRKEERFIFEGFIESKLAGRLKRNPMHTFLNY